MQRFILSRSFRSERICLNSSGVTLRHVSEHPVHAQLCDVLIKRPLRASKHIDIHQQAAISCYRQNGVCRSMHTPVYANVPIDSPYNDRRSNER